MVIISEIFSGHSVCWAQAVRQPLIMIRISESSSNEVQCTVSAKQSWMRPATWLLSMEGLHPPQNFIASRGGDCPRLARFLFAIQARISARASWASLSSRFAAFLLLGIIVETLSGFAPEIPGPNHFSKKWAGAVFGIPEFSVKVFLDH